MVDVFVVIIGSIIGVGGIVALIFVITAGFKQWNEGPIDPNDVPFEKRGKMEVNAKDFLIGTGLFILLMILLNAC